MMKAFTTSKIVLMAAVLFVAGCNQENEFQNWLASNIVEITSTDPAVTDYSDLSAFGDAVGDARIVMLDEQTHGEGNVFTLKTRLIKYLHEEKGFNVLMLESGMYDTHKIFSRAKTGQSVSASVPGGGSLFYVYAKSPEMQPLYKYIDQRLATESPLILAGFDSQHSGKISQQEMIDELESMLSLWQLKLISSGRWQKFKKITQALLRYEQSPPPVEDKKTFFAVINELREEMGKVESTSAGFWLHIVEGLKNQADQFWHGGKSYHRSPQMGDNVVWMANALYPNEKIIVWAHSIHLAKNGYNRIENAGKRIHTAFGEDVYLAHITGHHGDYLEAGTLKKLPYTLGQIGDLEASLNKTGLDIGFIHLNKSLFNFASDDITAAAVVRDSREAGIFDPIPLHQWRDAWDGVFFIKEMTAANYNDMH